METAAQFFNNGGVVMWPLLLLSILSLAMIMERSLFWFRLLRQQKKLLQRILTLYQEDLETARLMLERNRELPIASIFFLFI